MLSDATIAYTSAMVSYLTEDSYRETSSTNIPLEFGVKDMGKVLVIETDTTDKTRFESPHTIRIDDKITATFILPRPSKTASLTEIINGLDDEIHRMESIIANEEPDATISPNSKSALYAFFKTYRIDTVPDITVSDNGDLYASWRFERKQRLGLSFLSNGRIDFVLFIERDESGELLRSYDNDTASGIYHNIIKAKNLPCVKA